MATTKFLFTKLNPSLFRLAGRYLDLSSREREVSDPLFSSENPVACLIARSWVDLGIPKQNLSGVQTH